MAEVNEEVCDSPKEVVSCMMALKRKIMELESSLRILQTTFEQNYGPFSSTGNRKNGGKFRNISEKCNDVDESRFTDTTDQGHKRHSQSLCTGYPPDHEHNRELEFNTSEIDTSQTTDPDNSEHFIANAHESSIQSILAHSKDEKEWKPFSEEQCLYRRHSEGIVFPEIDRIIYANHRKRNHIYEHKPDPIETVSSNENASDEFFPVEDEMGSEEDLETLDRIETVALNENASNGLLSLEDEEIEVSKMEAETVENAEDSCELKNDLNDSSRYNTSCEDMEEKEEESCPKQVQIQDCIESCNSGFCGLNINSQIDEDESCTQAVINHSHVTTETDTDTDTGTSSENPTLDTPEFPMHDRVTEDGMTPNNGSSKSQCYTCPDLIGKDVPVIQDICQLDKVTNKEDNHAQNACQPHYQSVRHIECEPERELCTHCQSQNDHKSDLPLRPIHVAPDMGFTQNRNITVASMMDNFYSSHGEAIQECPQQLLTTWESSPREGNLHGLLQSENVGRVTPFYKQKYVSNCDRSTPSISVTLIEEMMPIKRNAFELQPTSRCFEMFSQGDTAMKCLMNALAFNETARTSFTTNELKIPQTDSVQFANTTIHCIRRVLLLIRLDHGCASYDVRLLRTELALHTETSMATKNGQGTFCILPLNAKRHVSDLFLCRTPNDQRLVNKQIQVDNDMMLLEGQKQDNFRGFPSLDQQLPSVLVQQNAITTTLFKVGDCQGSETILAKLCRSNFDRPTPSISVTNREKRLPMERNACELQPLSRGFEMFSQRDTVMDCLMNALALAFNENARTAVTTNEPKIPQTDRVQYTNTATHCSRQVLRMIRLDHGRASYDNILSRTESHMEIAMTTKNGQGTFCILPANDKRHVSDQFLCRTPKDQRHVCERIQVNNDMMQLKGQRQDNFRLFLLLDQQLLPNKGFRKEDMTEQSDYLEEGSQSKLHIRPWVKMKDKDNAQQYTRKPYKFAAPVKEIDQPMLLVHATGTTEKPSDHRVLHEQPNLDESDGHTGHKRKMGTSTEHNKEISNPTVPFKKDSLPKVVLELKSTTTCHKRLDIRNMKDGSMNSSHTLPALRRGVYRARRDNESSSCQSNSETKSNNCSNTNDGKANKVDRGTSSKDNGDDDQISVLGQSVHESNTKISIKEGSFEKGIEISGISVTNIQVGDECQALLQMDDTDTSTSINERNVAIDRPENVTVLEAPTSTNEKDVVRDYVTDLFEDKFDPSPLDGGKGTGSKMDPLTLFLCCTQRYMKTDGIASIILMLINQMGMWVKVYSDKDASDNQLPSIRSKNRGESIHIDFKKCEYGTKHSLNLQVGRANTMHVRCSMMKTLRGRCWFIPWFKSRPPLYGQDSYVKTITDRFNTMARHPQISWRNHDHMVFKIEFSMDLIHTLYEAAKAKVIKMVIKHHSQNDCTLLGNHSMPEGQCTILRLDRFAGRQNHTLSSISDFNVHNSFDISSDIKDAADGNVVFGGSHHFDVNSVEDEDENTYVDVDTNLVVDRLISGFHCIGDRFSDNDCHVPSTICNDCSSLNVVRKTTPDNVFSDQIEALSSGIHHDFLDSAIKQIVQVLNDSESFSALLHILDVQICSITDSGVYYLRSDNLSEVLTNLDNSYVQELLFEVLKGTELVAGVCINEAKDISPSFELRSRD